MFKIIFFALVILVTSANYAHAEDCKAGSGDSKWTLYTPQITIWLKGLVCIFNQDAGMWRGGHHKIDKIKSVVKTTDNEPQRTW